MNGRSMRLAVFAVAVAAAGAACVNGFVTRASASGDQVLLVGDFNGVTGAYTTIQSAVNAAEAAISGGSTANYWILVGPGDYHERQDYSTASWPAGVWVNQPGIHIRGMNRNSVIVDGTKPGAPACSSKPSDQDIGPSNQGRNGIEVYGVDKSTNPEGLFLANNTSVDNLTVCNFLTSPGGGNGNEVWWNGGDGGGQLGLSGYEGSYLTATSTYSNSSGSNTIGGACCGVNYPAGSYGIFSSDATHGSWTHDYASNMSDSSFYIGACQQKCDAVMQYDHGQYSSLCISTTNAGGYLLVDHMTCDLNKDGPVSNSQNNDDWPSPQIGDCDSADPSEPQKGATGTTSCTVWQYSDFSNNNNPNVPGNGTSGLAGGGPVGTGAILAGTQGITVYKNTFTNDKSWGLLVVDLPDQETGPANCQGGVLASSVPQSAGGPVCYWPATGNVSLDNTFLNDGGGYGVPNSSLADVGLATVAHPTPPFRMIGSANPEPGNCFSGDTDSGKPGGVATSDPAGMEVLPAYQSTNGLCTQSNTGDYGPLTATAECAAQLLAPCPTLETLCNYQPQLPCVPAPTPVDFPRPSVPFKLTMPPAQTTMPNPCAGVPANAFCASLSNPVSVNVGYVDNIHRGSTGTYTGPFAPSPWQGGAGVNFVGCNLNTSGTRCTDTSPITHKPCPSITGAVPQACYDGGALRFDNSSATAVVLTSVSVTVGGCTFSPWSGEPRGTLTVPAHGHLILTQTGGLEPNTACGFGPDPQNPYNFDTSDTTPGGTCAATGYIPVVSVTSSVGSFVYHDTRGVLNHGGVDPSCATKNANERLNWSALTQ